MVRTGIPVSVWEKEGWAVINTAIDLITEDDSRPAGGIDYTDDSTMPEAWR